MKIRVWNVNKGFARKASMAFEGDPDVVVLPESHRDFVRDGWSWGWVGNNVNSGLGVGVKVGLTGSSFQWICDQQEWFSVSELAVGDPTVIVGVWSCYKYSPKKAELGPVNMSIDEILKVIEGRNTIVAGDFNNGAKWDKVGRADNFMYTVERFREAGLVSAYHAHTGEEFGKELAPTFYSKRKQDQPFHIDYCFIPEEWVYRIASVSVGKYDDFIEWSDHMPMTIELLENE